LAVTNLILTDMHHFGLGQTARKLSHREKT
jgi:hypothetical protein